MCGLKIIVSLQFIHESVYLNNILYVYIKQNIIIIISFLMEGKFPIETVNRVN
jgi:hypothetical protein